MRKGFTLIELMVTIAIIGILSTIAVISFQGVRVTARDQQRRSDLAKLRTALETYFLRYNRYPIEDYENECDSSMGGSGDICDPTETAWDLAGGDDKVSGLKNLIDENIITSLPIDPKNKLENGIRFLYHVVFDKAGEGNPACLGAGDVTCRYLLQTFLENGDLPAGGKGQCIYSIIGGGGNPRNTTFGDPPSDCESNVLPSGWSGKPCCKS